MMESTDLNLDLHHQDGFHIASSSSSSSLAFPWNHQDIMLNGSGHDIMRVSGDHHQMPMLQDLGFQWVPAGGHGVMSMGMQEELSESFAKLTGMNLQDYYAGLQMPFQELHQPAAMSLGGNIRGTFGMVLPTANVSGSGLQSLHHDGLIGMDLQAFDLLASARFGRTMSQPSMLDTMSLLRDDLGYGPIGGQLQDAGEALPVHSTTYHKTSSLSGVTGTKRSNSYASQPAAPPAKKPRFESRSSFTPLKVRKEKLGDRIAALQQLVAPFGKTDTASVLMEAIGYIKFLQDQVETLSVPYMRSPNSKKTRTSQGASNEERSDEPKPDLKSRGLCLVPLPCTSYVTSEKARTEAFGRHLITEAAALEM